MKKWCWYGRKLFISVGPVWCKTSPVLLRKDRLPLKIKERFFWGGKSGHFSNAKNILSAPWWPLAVWLQVPSCQLKTCWRTKRWKCHQTFAQRFEFFFSFTWMCIWDLLIYKNTEIFFLFKDAWKWINKNPVVSFFTTSLSESFSLWSQDGLGPAGGVYLVLFFISDLFVRQFCPQWLAASARRR